MLFNEERVFGEKMRVLIFDNEKYQFQTIFSFDDGNKFFDFGLCHSSSNYCYAVDMRKNRISAIMNVAVSVDSLRRGRRLRGEK